MSQLPTFEIVPRKLEKVLLIMILVFGLVTVGGFFYAPNRIWASILLGSFYSLTVTIGIAFFITINYVANAGWMIAFRRVAESVASMTWIPFFGFLLLIFGAHSLYNWMHALGSHEAVSPYFRNWFNTTGFIIRLFIYFVIWMVLIHLINKNSLQQDREKNVEFTFKNIRLSAVFLVFGSVSFVLASIDWLMSLQMNWISTVFPLIPIAGALEISIAAIILILIYLRKKGYNHIFRDEHLKTLSNLLIAFSTMWVYLWVSQHLLIWYANIPEETSYYIFRHFGGGGSLSFLNVLLNWLLPFLVLLPGEFRMKDKILVYVSLVVIAGHWLDLYIIIMPSIYGAEPVFHFWELAPTIVMLLGIFLFALKRMKKYPLIPANDPYLVESVPATALHNPGHPGME